VSITLRKRIRRACRLGCVSGAALLVLAVGQASAAIYPNGGSTFTGSAEGWTGKTECPGIYAALNIPLLLCTSSAGYTGAAGNPAGSFNGTTEITLNLLQLFNSEEVATSPSFTATAGGSGTLKLDRQFAPEGLLQLAPHVDYTAYLVDKSAGGSKQKAIAETIEAASPFTTKTGGVTLIAGHTYTIEVVASIGSSIAGVEGIGLLGSTSFRFDNVSVTGPEPPNGPNPPNCNGCNGNNGGDGGNGGNGAEGGAGGAGGVSSARLESLMQSSLVGPAMLNGNRLSVKAKCPAKVGTTCTISLQGMLTKHKPATVGRKAKVKKGKTKSFVLSVKAPARAKVKTKQKLLFKETVKAGQAKATVWKTLKLVRK
jgi:hypothetical protein